MQYNQAAPVNELLKKAKRIVIVQADNPDADSLGSALALEQILGDMSKEPILYCGVSMPSYLKYLSGWDRVISDLPTKFDASIIVDTSTITLLEKLSSGSQIAWLKSKPCLVIDHHGTSNQDISFASHTIIDDNSSSTGEVIYNLAKQLDWPLSVTAQSHIMTAILGDTQGLSNQLTLPTTYRIMADMVEAGVNRPELEEKRREYSKMPLPIYKYKGTLIEHTEFYKDGLIALVTVGQEEINEYSPLYNPGPLIQGDMLQTTPVAVSIVIKHYDDGHITGAIRTNAGYGIAAKLAEELGGGGHDYASGFKIDSGKTLDEVKQLCIDCASSLLDNLNLR